MSNGHPRVRLSISKGVCLLATRIGSHFLFLLTRSLIPPEHATKKNHKVISTRWNRRDVSMCSARVGVECTRNGVMVYKQYGWRLFVNEVLSKNTLSANCRPIDKTRALARTRVSACFLFGSCHKFRKKCPLWMSDGDKGRERESTNDSHHITIVQFSPTK
jgi:hypothetical protein